MAIYLSHGGTTVYSSASPSDRVLVGTKEGIAAIERGSSGWRVAGRVLEDKFVSSITREPESGLLFAGAFLGGRTRER